jgi:hypothetical protein
MSREGQAVAAVIPAYQAGRTVGEVVRRTRALLPAVLVVDDGSRDDTAGEAARAGAEVMRLAENRGKGHALHRLTRLSWSLSDAGRRTSPAPVPCRAAGG